MKISIICVGKIKESFYRQAIDEYAKRLSKYCKFEVIEVADEKTPDKASEIQENIDRYANASSASSNKAIAASLVGMYAAIPIYNKATVDKEVLLYKQAHPKTTMSDAEITNMVKETLKKDKTK